jgi:tRNA threonylcarbamoyladenosine biosynthesis protein TsaE
MTATTTSDAAQTEALGADLAARLSPGDVVLVRGELGAGKTTFVRGAARALGVRGPVTSPTFTLANRYSASSGYVSHLDLYRLVGAGAQEPGLLADYIDGTAIAFVEWPVEDESTLTAPRATVTIEHAGGDQRRIAVEEHP